MLSRIRDRKVVQWVAAYAVAAWAIVQVVDVVGGGFGWSATPLRVAVILALAGAPMVAVLGWYHGEKGSQRVSRREGFLLGICAVFGIAGLAAFASAPGFSLDPDPSSRRVSALDSSSYVVLPFRRDAGMEQDLFEDLLLHDAITRWQGLRSVDPLQIRDEIEQKGELVGLEESARLARRLGAGRLLTGEFVILPGGLRIRAAVYDSRSLTMLADTTLLVGMTGSFGDSIATAVVSHLLFRGAGLDPAEGSDPTTTSFAARRAFLSGMQALRRWELLGADSLFALALTEDPGYARAHLWKAQARNWHGTTADALLTSAEIADAASGRLSRRERLLAAGLLALAREEFAGACAIYDSLLAMDERDFAAWYGLGECHGRDNGVLRDETSPSNWSFRGSKHRSVEAYRRAFEVLPLAHRGLRAGTFERVGDLLFVSKRIRQGRGLHPDTGVFWARPSIVADTLAFVPLRLAVFLADADASRPSTYWQALERQRHAFSDLAQQWVSAFPVSVPALRALALARELTADPEALDLIRRARSLSEDPHSWPALMIEEIRLLVKLGGPGQFTRAATLADSLLSRDWPGADPAELAEIAALTGRASLAAVHARTAARSQQGSVAIPATVMASADALLAFASLGGPRDSVLAAERVLAAGLASRFPPQQRHSITHSLLDRPASLAFMRAPLQATGELTAHTRYPVLRAQSLLAAGDTPAAAAIVEEQWDRRATLRATDVAIETLYAEAWVMVAAGRHQQAGKMLQDALDGLRWAEPGYLGDVAKCGALVRAMALRADLAARTGDTSTRRLWASAVVDLWQHADPHLQPLVRRMRILASDRIPVSAQGR